MSSPTIDEIYTGLKPRRYRFSGDYRAARELVEFTMRPASKETLGREMVRLRALTVSRNGDYDDIKVLIAAYIDALQEYPGDAVVAALRQWPHHHKFWPPLAEIVEAMRECCPFRFAIAEDLGLR